MWYSVFSGGVPFYICICQLQNLEQSWDMKVGSLKLITVANTIYCKRRCIMNCTLCRQPLAVRKDFGQAYLEGHWLLIPPINTLVLVYESYKGLDPGDTNRWHEVCISLPHCTNRLIDSTRPYYRDSLSPNHWNMSSFHLPAGAGIFSL